jgi:hypothetical protein
MHSEHTRGCLLDPVASDQFNSRVQKMERHIRIREAAALVPLLLAVMSWPQSIVPERSWSVDFHFSQASRSRLFLAYIIIFASVLLGHQVKSRAERIWIFNPRHCILIIKTCSLQDVLIIYWCRE